MKYLLPLLLLALITACYKGDRADLIIHNATIYSCDEDFSVFDAMAIRDGKIIQMGPEREILNGYKCDNIVDAQTRPIYPGFYDGHCHFMGYAMGLGEADLTGSRSFDEVLERLEKFDAENDIPWIKGRSWDQSLWGNDSFPDNKQLNLLFPDKPVLIRRVDGHAAIANDYALNLAGFTTDTEIEGGYIGQSNHQLTGLLLDNAYDSVAAYMPEASAETKLEFLKQAEYNLFQEGLTSLNDAGIESKNRELFVQWYSNNELKIKSYAMLFPDDDNIDFAYDNGVFSAGNLTIRSFKLIADGALGSRGACLLHPYSDDIHNHGFMLRDTTEFGDVTRLASEINYQVNTHCIGDSANRSILQLYANVIQSKPDHRWKIEHAQVLAPTDFDLFEAINIIPSVQPTHCTSDMRWAEDRLGSERITGAYAYKTLLDKAGTIVLGTDFPVENISALETFYAAITRKDKNGNPTEGFYPAEALSREEALKGMTIWAAHSNFEEKERGSLEEGKAADFVMLTKDIMKVATEDILTTYVVKTYLDGELVYDGE